jgi:hypothetical protein
MTDELELLRMRLERTEDAIRNCQTLVCTLRDADISSPRESDLRELVEARDCMRNRLNRLMSCKRTIDERR